MGYILGELMNRNFHGVNGKFGLRLGDEIEKRIKEKPELTICDIGCGPDAKAIIELVHTYPEIKGIGLDYKLEAESKNPRLNLIKGDLFDIPFENSSDITYCAFVLPDIREMDLREQDKKIGKAVYQISKTLVLGGIAFIDEGIYSSNKMHLENLTSVIEGQNPGYANCFEITNDPDLRGTDNFMIVNRRK